jgi:hypothetical protein
MSGLAERDLDPDAGMCAECRRRPAVGPCAACEAMICGDCGVITTDPSGKRCICASCARLVASVGAPAPRRRSGTLMLIALVVLAAFAIGAVAALGR